MQEFCEAEKKKDNEMVPYHYSVMEKDRYTSDASCFRQGGQVLILGRAVNILNLTDTKYASTR